MWRGVSIRLYNVWEPSWTIRYGIFINLEIWITAVQSDDVNDEYIYVCGVWRSNVFVSSGLKIILLLLNRNILWDSVNLWCWCLFLLQNEWPVLHLFLIYFFNYLNGLNSFEILTWGNCYILLGIQYCHLVSLQLFLQPFFCCLVWIGKNSGRREESFVADQSNWSQAN